MKAYKIDAYTNTITELEMSEDYREISQNIGCEMFCVAKTLPNGDTLFVDDEGWINPSVTRAFQFDGRVFAGNGVVLGCNRGGESESAKTKELDIAKLVGFAPKGFEISQEMRDAAMGSWKVVAMA
jgi:hypothetical protein